MMANYADIDPLASQNDEDAETEIAASTEAVCELCGRNEVALTRHHLIPPVSYTHLTLPTILRV